MAEYLVNLSGNICELLIVLFFVKDKYKLRLEKKIFIPTCILLVALQFVNTNLFLSQSQLILIGSYLFVFLILLMFSIKKIYRFLLCFFIVALIGLSEFVVGMTLTTLFDVDIPTLQRESILFAICTLTSKFLAYCFILITKRKKIITSIQPLNKNIAFVISLPIASFLVMILFLSCCYQIDNSVFHIITFVTSITLIFANIMVFHVINKQNELIETKEKLIFAEKHIGNQTIHYQELYKYQNELRVFRHDIKNRLAALLGLVKNNETNKAIQIMEKNLNWLNEMNDNIVNSGNPVIDAILQSKLYETKEKGIEIDYFIRFASAIGIDEIEFGTIVGNALDNAIEAVDKLTENSNKQIQFKLITTQGQISILIKNPVNENVDTNNLFTTKEDKKLHGHGINSIRAIAEKYNGTATFSCENKIFTTDINLTNNPSSTFAF